MSEESGCQCFMCANKDNKVAVKSYLIGQLEAYKNVVENLKRCGVNIEPLSHENTLGALLTECLYNVDACGSFLSEMHDIKLEGKTVREIDEMECLDAE